MHSIFIRPVAAAVALAACSVAGTPTLAETVSYKADLKGSSEVPPNEIRKPGPSTRHTTPRQRN